MDQTERDSMLLAAVNGHQEAGKVMAPTWGVFDGVRVQRAALNELGCAVRGQARPSGLFGPKVTRL